MSVKQIVAYLLILAVAVGLVAAWRYSTRLRKRDRSSSRINLIDRD